MEIRLASYEPTSLVAISLAPGADEMPRAVRIVDPAVAAEVEALVEAHLGERLVGVDLDVLVAEAEERVDAARR
ncbi:hypothetical protein GCM10023201_00670 [Actinomycetospora corticicola]|uniref:Uncharacterized protein n=1 Tax=Actinomycetospora corticicola TaxID=663602 RepID=A0A7Y9J8J0_9PSEU|nr:hypothetical protein [Actinomycetospora corticicola]NYD39338.1 hypothetical protein [Actinomycetospora corticicola]